MFHESKGLFFQRRSDGSVRVIKTYDEREPRPDNVVLDHIIPEGCWASIICSMSKDGETAERWREALQFHGTVSPWPNSPPDRVRLREWEQDVRDHAESI